jgi:hypothetical protein
VTLSVTEDLPSAMSTTREGLKRIDREKERSITNTDTDAIDLLQCHLDQHHLVPPHTKEDIAKNVTRSTIVTTAAGVIEASVEREVQAPIENMMIESQIRGVMQMTDVIAIITKSEREVGVGTGTEIAGTGQDTNTTMIALMSSEEKDIMLPTKEDEARGIVMIKLKMCTNMVLGEIEMKETAAIEVPADKEIQSLIGVRSVMKLNVIEMMLMEKSKTIHQRRKAMV